MAEGSKLVIEDLHVSVEGNEIIKGLSLEVKTGEVHAIMGPNGSGKSTLAYTLMGHPRYDVTEGSVTLDGEDLLDMEPDERARAGLFLAFQYPTEIEGVTVANFLRTAINARRGPGNEISVSEFAKKLREKMELLDMDPSFAQRYLNDGFSGGEKKRNEILQMAMLEPTFAIMDETDSGLDIDALQIVSNGVNQLKGPHMGVIVITHYQRILRYLEPDFVHVLVDGRIVRSGGKELAEELEEKGYDWIRQEVESGRM
ncbi:MAG: Fe-S cluster assembly ATPase SufC [Firmicutes bacterium]|jgi:Fe-S cluster assembly ATP-binding protein|nr:Fe-S cluster assembly ATPase SufC [Bacillota bacterium]